jgi:hypothetical protein
MDFKASPVPEWQRTSKAASEYLNTRNPLNFFHITAKSVNVIF